MKINYKKAVIDFFKIISILISLSSPVQAAEEIAFVSGLFKRSIPIEHLESYLNGEEPKGVLKKLNKLNTKNGEDLSKIFNEKYDLSLTLTSRLMNSKIGDVMLKRIAKIIYPIKAKDSSISVPAIRSAVIQGLVLGEGSINLILFFKAYPNKTIAIDVPALFKVLDKVDSITDLVKFFSNSPLEKLKVGGPKD